VVVTFKNGRSIKR